MICPFQNEMALVSICDEVHKKSGIDEKIGKFRPTLTELQKKMFDEIDDTHIGNTTHIQHNTIRSIHCPNCDSSGCP